MKLTDAIKQALAKKKGEHVSTESLAPDQTKPAAPGPKRGSSVSSKPPKKVTGRGR